MSYIIEILFIISAIPSNKVASGSPSNESSRPNSPPDNNTPTKNGIR